MKVLHFYKTYHPDTVGGIEQVIFQLAEGGRAHGIESQVLSLSPHGAYRNVPIANHLGHRSRRDLQLASTAFSLSALSDFKELARNVDLVHFHFPWPFMDLVHLLSGLHKPAIASYHSDIVKQRLLLQLYKPLMHRFLSKMQRIVAASPNYVESSQVLQQYVDKVQVIPYGLDRSTYASANQEQRDYWRKRVGGKFFLFLGVLRYYKGLHILLEAMVDTPYTVVIAGSGPVEHELRQQAQRLNLNNLHLVGQVSEEDKTALLELCYAITFPSHLRSEAFGISLLEGAMFGKPLISSEIGTGTSFINIHGVTGFNVPPSNPTALREAMASLWNNPQQSQEMGLKARQRYQSHFTSESMARSYAQLYRDVLTAF
ncbi:MAG: glycosyltransferase family 4 protein [Pseudomonas sp.]